MLIIIGLIFSSLLLINGYPSNINDDGCFNNCSNNGVCFPINDERICFCFPEWDGEYCDMARIKNEDDASEIKPMNRIQLRNDPCAFVPNLCNGGFCSYEAASGNGTGNGTGNGRLVCTCKYKDQGDRCQYESACVDYCKNGGFCSATEDGETACACPPGWSGNRCIRPASTPPTTTPQPTTNFICSVVGTGFCKTGTCLSVNGKPVCQCPPTHTGEYCERQIGASPGPGPTNSPIIPGPNPTNLPSNYKACSSGPCKNGRPCYNTGNDFFCDCGRSYTGKDCSTQTSG